MRTIFFQTSLDQAAINFPQTMRKYRTVVFFAAFALFSINSHIASQMPDNEMAAKKWAAAYRSLERALSTATTTFNFISVDLLKK